MDTNERPLNPEEKIAYVGRILIDRRLTDFCGGNISIRQGDQVYMSPRYAGARQQWNLDPATVVSGSLASDEILLHPSFSREGRSHIGVYRNYPQAAAIIHAHPFHVMPFCAGDHPLVPVVEATEKYGRIEVVPYAPAHTQELADRIVAALKGKEVHIEKNAAVLLLSRHGIIVVAKELFGCLDVVERMDVNAWCILAQKLLPDLP
jgi:L-fuculose-phosphate aldolase